MESKLQKYLIRRVCEMVQLGWADFQIIQQLQAVHSLGGSSTAGDLLVKKYTGIARQLGR